SRLRFLAVGLAFLGDLARQRSLAAAALLFLMLVDEIEGLIFLAVGILLDRKDLFMSSQEVLFPAVVVVSAVVSIVRNVRRHRAETKAEPVEMMDVASIVARVGEPQIGRASWRERVLGAVGAGI